ncbi:hypothetical protein [Pseudomonas graminis]|uniref:hypothetical protein n=1 Tax=Pseudomonas graminis TaxID=158627 RepID=UPI003C24D45F
MKTEEQSKVDGLFNLRNDHLRKLQDTFELDALGVKRLEKMIQSLVKPIATQSRLQAALQHELAYTAGMTRNLQQALAKLTISRNLGLDDFSVSLSRSHILMMNGRYSDCADLLRTQLQTGPSAAQIPFLIPHMLQIGMIETAKALMPVDSTDGILVTNITLILGDIGAGEHQLTERLDYAARMVMEFAPHPILAFNMLADRDEGILYQFIVDAGPEALARLEDRIIDGLVDNFEGPLDGVLAIGVAPFLPGESARGKAYSVRI